jgi:glycosyltransferase involved in cell wall biosynthesis
MKIKFSIIVPTFNLEHYITETLTSILNQSYRNFEVIIIDDGSSDHTFDKVNILAEQDKRIHILRNPKSLGVSKTRNLGIASAKGDWIAFLDGDDIWATDHLKNRVEIINKYIDVDFISSDFYNWNSMKQSQVPESEKNILWANEFKQNNDKEYIHNNIIKVFMEKTCFTCTDVATIRKDLINKVGYFDETLKTSEDTHYWLRIANQSNKFIYIPKATAYYRQRENSLSKNSSGPVTKNATKMFLRLANDPQFITYRAILKEKALSYSMINTYFYRENNMYTKAIKSGFCSLTIKPFNKLVIRNFIAALLGK